jgi:hypothetical protein
MLIACAIQFVISLVELRRCAYLSRELKNYTQRHQPKTDSYGCNAPMYRSWARRSMNDGIRHVTCGQHTQLLRVLEHVTCWQRQMTRCTGNPTTSRQTRSPSHWRRIACERGVIGKVNGEVNQSGTNCWLRCALPGGPTQTPH